MANVVSGHTFAICVKNEDYEASLELRKLYEVLPDPKSEQLGMVRVVDESGEDYLYPQAFFVRISLSDTVEEHRYYLLHDTPENVACPLLFHQECRLTSL